MPAILIVETRVYTSLRATAEQMIREVNESGWLVRAYYQGVELQAWPDTDGDRVEQVIAQYFLKRSEALLAA